MFTDNILKTCAEQPHMAARIELTNITLHWLPCWKKVCILAYNEHRLYILARTQQLRTVLKYKHVSLTEHCLIMMRLKMMTALHMDCLLSMETSFTY